MSFSQGFSVAAAGVARASGHPVTFAASCLIIVVWGISGPIFGYSDTWQLIINRGTTIVTFLMVFLIQNTQNRDGAAVQAKLDELIRSSAAQNAFIGIEHLSQEEVEAFRKKCEDAGAEALGKLGDRALERANERAEKAADDAHGLEWGRRRPFYLHSSFVTRIHK